MLTRIQTWGNSQGIRIPKIILDESGISVNDELDMSAEGNVIVLKKTESKRHVSLQDRLEQYYGKPLSQINAIEQDAELSWGKNEGSEIW